MPTWCVLCKKEGGQGVYKICFPKSVAEILPMEIAFEGD